MAEEVDFWWMSEAALRQWVEANPGRVNDRNWCGYTPLYAAVSYQDYLPLVVWLLDEKGADMNARSSAEAVVGNVVGLVGYHGCGVTPLHADKCLDIFNALVDRGGDPNLLSDSGYSPLMIHASAGRVCVARRLLQDPRVRDTIDMQDRYRWTALHHACSYSNERMSGAMVRLLLEAGANPTLAYSRGETLLVWLRRKYPFHHPTIALLEKALANAEKTSLLVKEGHLAVAVRSSIVAPSCLHARVARGQTLPGVELVVMGCDQNDDEDEEKERKLRTAMIFLLGMGGGPEGEGMPSDVFRVVLDLLMPSWDTLRKRGGVSLL